MTKHKYGPFDNYREVETINGALGLLPGEVVTIDDEDPDRAVVREKVGRVIDTGASGLAGVPRAEKPHPAAPSTAAIQLESLTKADLVKLGKERGVEVYKSWSHDKLVKALS